MDDVRLSPDVIVKGSPKATLIFIFLVLGLFILGPRPLRNADIILFVMFCFSCFFNLINPKRLMICRDGFTERTLWCKNAWQWHEIKTLRAKTEWVSNLCRPTIISWSVQPGVKQKHGRKKSLNANWAMSDNDLLALMQSRLDDCRARHGG